MRDLKIVLALFAVIILQLALSRFFGFWPVTLVILAIATIVWAVYPRRAE
jgi:hypothetical protein